MIATIVSYEELPSWVDKEFGLSNNGHGKENANYIIIEDGDYRACYSDACEPEDASFGRDFYWIISELNRLRP